MSTLGRIILGDPAAVSRVGINGSESAQSETSIRLSRGTGSLIVAPQGLYRSFLKNFAAVYPDPTDRPWASEDEVELEFGHFVSKVSVKSGCELSLIVLSYNSLNHLVTIITTESTNL